MTLLAHIELKKKMNQIFSKIHNFTESSNVKISTDEIKEVEDDENNNNEEKKSRQEDKEKKNGLFSTEI